MKKIISGVLVLISLTCIFFIGFPDSLSNLAVVSTNDENLGPASIEIKSGTGMVTAGVGLLSQPGNLKITVPNKTIKQVLIYWQGFADTKNGLDDSILLQKGSDAAKPVTGTKIGSMCPNEADCVNFYSSTFRADITDLNLITQGINTLKVSGLNFNEGSNGAGIAVIYEDPNSAGAIGILDGHDYAFHKQTGILKTTNPKTLSFAASNNTRSATLHYFVSSVEGSLSGGGLRPTSIEVTINGVTNKCSDCLHSLDGQEWDSLTLPIVIPAGATSVTTQVFSRDDFNRSALDSASLVWNFLGISIEDQLSDPCLPGDGNKLVRGIDVAGYESIINGEQWDNGSVNFSYSGTAFTDDSVPLIPAIADPNIDSMIRSSVWHGMKNNKELYMTVNGVRPHKYDLFFWSWEDDASDNFTLNLEGTPIGKTLSSGAAGKWVKLGPYTRDVLDGSLNITASGGDGLISGIELRCPAGATTPTPAVTPTAIKTATISVTATPTRTPTRTATASRTSTATATNTSTPAATKTATPTATKTHTATSTPVVCQPIALDAVDALDPRNQNPYGSGVNPRDLLRVTSPLIGKNGVNYSGSVPPHAAIESLVVKNPDGTEKGSITIKNIGLCAVKAGLASYKKYTRELKDEINFDFDVGIIQPGEERTFNVRLPDCAAEIDAFWGNPILEDQYATNIAGTYLERMYRNRVAYSSHLDQATAAILPRMIAYFDIDTDDGMLLGNFTGKYPYCTNATPTATPTATKTATKTATATRTATKTATPTASATSTATRTATLTRTATPTNTSTATVTKTRTATPTSSATSTATFTATSTRTATPTSTSTATVTKTATATLTATFTATPTKTATLTPTFTATFTPTSTATSTYTPTSTPTATFTPTATPTPDCAGISGGTSVIDDCGICNGNNSSKGCDGVCFSDKKVDDCNVCNGENKNKGCDNICFSGKKNDACGVCGGNVTDALSCISSQCVTVPATKDIVSFEKRFVKSANGLIKRIREDAKRDAKYKCGLKSSELILRSKEIQEELMEVSTEIFGKGVEVCGDSCITISFAEQVKVNQSKLKELEQISKTLANQVNKCYNKNKVKVDNKGGRVQDVISQSRQDLNKLVNDCKKTTVCSPVALKRMGKVSQ